MDWSQARNNRFIDDTVWEFRNSKSMNIPLSASTSSRSIMTKATFIKSTKGKLTNLKDSDNFVYNHYKEDPSGLLGLLGRGSRRWCPVGLKLPTAA